MPAQHRNYISQTNVKLPNDLKEWARQQASQDFQSLSGFISKLINEGKKRRETAKTVCDTQLGAPIQHLSL